MTEHGFGGLWTSQKLDAPRNYIGFFLTAMQGQRFRLVYIDTFAGTGKCSIRVPGGRETIEGSAAIALNAVRPFDEYFFVEAKAKHVMQLQALARGHTHGNRVRMTHGDAREHLEEILQRQDWAATRGVLFLDPYGLQCTWAMVEQIASTKLDVFFLVSLAGLSRQAATSEAAVDSVKAASLDRFLGTDAWRSALYAPPATHDLFEDHPGEQTRCGGTEAIMRFMHERLQEVFAHVVEPVVLRTSRNAALFALFFSVSNRAPAAKALAGRVARDVLSKLR